MFARSFLAGVLIAATSAFALPAQSVPAVPDNAIETIERACARIESAEGELAQAKRELQQLRRALG